MYVELYDVSVLSHGCMKLWINWWIYEDVQYCVLVDCY